ncbi:MAG: hypothetical protein JWQ11_2683 [Rhizobacter sp.]|nr:hypothetical protein [Rhizobacter sp.]
MPLLPSSLIAPKNRAPHGSSEAALPGKAPTPAPAKRGFGEAANLPLAPGDGASAAEPRPLAPTSTAPTKPRLLLFHGLLSAPDEFGLIGHPLRREGVDFEAVTLPFYTRADTRADTTVRSTWQQWVDQACARVDAVPDDGRPLVLAGLCTGGQLAAAVASRRAGRVDGVLLMSPAFTQDGWGLPWWYRLRYLGYALGITRFFDMHERAPYGVKNERLRGFIEARLSRSRAVGGIPASIPLWAVREAERLGAAVLPRLRELPRLAILHSRLDEISTLDGLLASLRRGGCEPRCVTVLENSFHMITVDNDRAQVAGLLAGFVGETSVRASAAFAG